MQEAITFEQLGWIIVFIIVVGVGIFAALALKSLNHLLKQVNGILEKNQEHVNRLIPNLAEISDGGVLIAKDLQKTVHETGQAIEVATHSASDAVRKFSDTADHVGTYAIIAGEVAKVLIELFTDRNK
jgi:ABC-type transporter Mla subunit MlaD